MTPVWVRLMGGCHLDRRTVDLIRASGLGVCEVTAIGRERWTLFPIYRGTAVKAV